jgi:phosphoenolpyruvate phosphomutase
MAACSCAADDRCDRLRALLGGPGLVRVAGAHSGLSARLVEDSGFDAVWASGFELSTAHALPDASILTMSELLEAARNMHEATSIPVIADCDTGFGDIPNVVHMVRRYEASGIAGVCIEDKHFPKLNSFVRGGQELLDVDHFADKLRAAKGARRTRDLVVIARTEALIAGRDISEALRRAAAYAEAGADAVLVHSRRSAPDEIWAFLERWDQRVPVVVVPTTFYAVDASEFERRGVRVVIYANHGLRAAVRAMQETLRELREAGTSTGVEDRIASVGELLELQGMSALVEKTA